ncbi:MAG: hypothetical protein H6624_06515 [Bdellovibrionaceae bacterium]|nr:hypothetical protein [Bdellovibrionales bacterium]MCB9083977.1 hypothetical protein [Pseudobdellovibrionaceae bacterium]
MKLMMVFAVVFVSVGAWAHGSRVQAVEQATVVALEMFETTEPRVAVDSFNAVKSWISGDQLMVRAYYNNNAENVLYACEWDHSGHEEKMVCEKR